MGHRYVAIHVNAGHTPNGNPRRLYLIVDTERQRVVDAVDEGSRGSHGIELEFGKKVTVIDDAIATSAAEYRRLLKEYEGKSKRIRSSRSGDKRRSSRR